MSVRALLIIGLILTLSNPVRGQAPDPERGTPYLWRVLIQVKPHPLLDLGFRDQLRQDIAAALQPGLGSLGTVEIVDLASIPAEKADPLWRQVAEKGFASALSPAPDRELTGIKTHVLHVEYRDGTYLLESKQYDGFSGLASPVVRKASVRAAELVGRSAGLMLDRDFGLAGTIEPGSRPDEVRVVVRGGKLGRMDRFLSLGDVFAVSQLARTNRPAPEPVRTATGKLIAPPTGALPPLGLTAKPRDYTYLKVEDLGADGTCRCQVLSRGKPLFPADARIAGYRCLKITTTTAPLTVRLVGSDGRPHQQGSSVSVRATDRGFDPPTTPGDNLTFRDGLYRSGGTVANLACISVSLGPTMTERFPVPMLSADAVTLRVELDPKVEERAAFERECQAVAGRAADARSAQAACFAAVARLITDQQNVAARDRAREGVAAADAADKAIADDLSRLRGALDRQVDKPAAYRDSITAYLAAIEQQTRALRTANAQLATRVKDLDAILAKKNDPTASARELQVENVNLQIKGFLERGEIDQALNAYDQLLTLLPGNAELIARRDRLKAEWAPKSDEHTKAREFLFKTWPGLTTTADFKDNLRLLRTAADTCINAGDRYGCRKALTLFPATAVKLTALSAALDPANDADRKPAADLKEIREVVGKVDQDLADFLRRAEGDKGAAAGN